MDMLKKIGSLAGIRPLIFICVVLTLISLYVNISGRKAHHRAEQMDGYLGYVGRSVFATHWSKNGTFDGIKSGPILSCGIVTEKHIKELFDWQPFSDNFRKEKIEKQIKIVEHIYVYSTYNPDDETGVILLYVKPSKELGGYSQTITMKPTGIELEVASRKDGKPLIWTVYSVQEQEK